MNIKEFERIEVIFLFKRKFKKVLFYLKDDVIGGSVIRYREIS